MTRNNKGILLTNVGSPDHPTPAAVRQYLNKFLSDPRVVEIPRIIWLPILYGFILRKRPHYSAQLYQKIWTENGSPLLFNSKQIATKLSAELNLPVEIGMHYGNPTIKSALENLRSQGAKKILILPMYPQYSATTTAVTFDQVADVLNKWRDIPEIRTVHSYAINEGYILELCNFIQKQPIKHLLFSFHGIPKRHVDNGDPYYEQCMSTVRLVTEKLNLTNENFSISFQSRIGRTKWLMPYTDQVLQELPQRGIKDLHVICPGFSVDCLETLEEIAIRGRKQFLNAGGESFNYISAMNDSTHHLSVLKNIISQHSYGW